MPEYIKAPTGAFCWIELSTTDVAAAKKFYGRLFDWTLTDAPMPLSDGTAYVMASSGGKNVAGIMNQPAEAKKMGAPPFWLSYVAVDDAAASAQKVAPLGGKVLMGPAVMGPGKMALVQDPTGGVLALWQVQQPMGTFLFGEPNSMGWNELSSTNVDRAGSFYSGLFGWKLEIAKMPGMDYVTFKNGDELAGGMMAQPKELAGAPSSWGVYFAVADADATAAKAKSLGATVIVPPTDIPTIGRFAVVLDPQGVAFSVIKFLPRAS
jgi:predicted enzyme related to lactoylglutathione lyase